MTKRTVITITGADRETFLQGLISNDVSRAGEKAVYAALLSPQGKYLADFFVQAEDDALLLDCDPSLAGGLAQRLSMYKLRAKVDVATRETVVTRGRGPLPPGATADPRAPEMGWRDIQGHAADEGVDWDDVRVAHCIPETGIELIPNETYILEAGFERLNGVDFRKGCYVGQEVTARMKHKTELKKGLRQIKIEGEAPIGTEIVSNGKTVGRVYTQASGHAIAHLRFDRITEDMTAGAARVKA